MAWKTTRPQENSAENGTRQRSIHETMSKHQSDSWRTYHLVTGYCICYSSLFLENPLQINGGFFANAGKIHKSIFGPWHCLAFRSSNGIPVGFRREQKERGTPRNLQRFPYGIIWFYMGKSWEYMGLPSGYVFYIINILYQSLSPFFQ